MTTRCRPEVTVMKVNVGAHFLVGKYCLLPKQVGDDEGWPAGRRSAHATQNKSTLSFAFPFPCRQLRHQFVNGLAEIVHAVWFVDNARDPALMRFRLQVLIDVSGS